MYYALRNVSALHKRQGKMEDRWRSQEATETWQLKATQASWPGNSAGEDTTGNRGEI